jgi:XRE family transcriptional regulator of biofilm formation
MDKRETIDLVRLGHKIRFLRQGKGWSLADLEKESGVSKAYISDIENGVAGKPNIQYVFSIAKALGVTLDELVYETSKEHRSATGSRKEKSDLPPGLAELQRELNLTDEDVEMLGTVNFRGHRPTDKEGWRFLLETIRMLSGRKPLT